MSFVLDVCRALLSALCTWRREGRSSISEGFFRVVYNNKIYRVDWFSPYSQIDNHYLPLKNEKWFGIFFFRPMTISLTSNCRAWSVRRFRLRCRISIWTHGSTDPLNNTRTKLTWCVLPTKEILAWPERGFCLRDAAFNYLALLSAKHGYSLNAQFIRSPVFSEYAQNFHQSKAHPSLIWRDPCKLHRILPTRCIDTFQMWFLALPCESHVAARAHAIWRTAQKSTKEKSHHPPLNHDPSQQRLR